MRLQKVTVQYSDDVDVSCRHEFWLKEQNPQIKINRKSAATNGRLWAKNCTNLIQPKNQLFSNDPSGIEITLNSVADLCLSFRTIPFSCHTEAELYQEKSIFEWRRQLTRPDIRRSYCPYLVWKKRRYQMKAFDTFVCNLHIASLFVRQLNRPDQIRIFHLSSQLSASKLDSFLRLLDTIWKNKIQSLINYCYRYSQDSD